MHWRRYHDNGIIFTDQDGTPHEGPGYGVIGIWQDAADKKLINGDYYIFRSDYGCWIETKLDGLIDHLVTAAPHVAAVKAGRCVPGEVFTAVMHRMNQDVEA